MESAILSIGVGVDSLRFYGDSRLELNDSRPSTNKNEGLGVSSELIALGRGNLD